MFKSIGVYEEINLIKPINEMMKRLEKLGKDVRKEVILWACRKSKHQSTWSFFAEHFGIPENEWPEREFKFIDHRGREF